MKILSLSEAKMKLSGLVDMVQATDEEIVIIRNGPPAKETAAILADATLMDEISKSLQALKDKKACLYSLEKLFDESAS